MQEARIHWVQKGIPVRAINGCMELCVQCYRMSAACNAEVRRVGGAVHDYIPQSSRVLTAGRKDSADPFDRAQISVVERIVPLHGRIARSVLLPWSKEAIGLN